jgi:cell division protein FtsI (penicillin-binding protein 3)
MVAAALVLVLFVGRLVQVQIFQGPGLAAKAQADRMTTTVTPAHRGDIVDADGTVLATSVDRYTVVADQLAIQGFRSNSRVDAEGQEVADGALGVAQLLGPVLGQPKAELAARLNGDSQYAVLAKNVVPEVQRAIADLGLQAYLRTELTSRRSYPAGKVAGTLVGYVDSQQEGQGGIEAAWDDVLAGTDGKAEYERGRDGVRIPGAEQETVPAVPGSDVVLTIEDDIQWKAEDALDQAVSATGSSYGMAIVQDLRTGELLALADSGDVDPNDRSTARVAEGSRAVKDLFEPGSTGKVITMAAALEGGYWEPTSRFTVPYRFTTPNGQTFSDSHEHPTQRLTLAGILAHSSNTGTVQVGEKIPRQVRYDYLRKFGFGESTGLGLPGEENGLMPPSDVSTWDDRTQYTVLFGQSVAVNAVQATAVFSTVANGGVRMAPTLFAGSRSPEGKVTPASREPGERVVSQETADTLVRMMESVTGEEGTGSAAQVPGYRVAGKTGTAQMFLPGGGMTYMASFIGFAPAQEPRYTVSVFLKSPQTSIFGGVVAAPVFSDIMGFTLQKKDVPPSTGKGKPIRLTWK